MKETFHHLILKCLSGFVASGRKLLIHVQSYCITIRFDCVTNHRHIHRGYIKQVTADYVENMLMPLHMREHIYSETELHA